MRRCQCSPQTTSSRRCATRASSRCSSFISALAARTASTCTRCPATSPAAKHSAALSTCSRVCATKRSVEGIAMVAIRCVASFKRNRSLTNPCFRPWRRMSLKTRVNRANALKSLSQHHLEQVLGIQCTGEAFAGQTLLAGVLPQEIERDVAQHGKVLGTVVLAEPTLIFPKGDIERPMEPVLNAPVVAHGAGKLLCVRFQASEVEALLYRSLPG